MYFHLPNILQWAVVLVDRDQLRAEVRGKGTDCGDESESFLLDSRVVEFRMSQLTAQEAIRMLDTVY